MNKTTELILKAYELTDRVTPLKTDCGKLCDACCCKGDSDTGMWLFPGEEKLVAEDPDFTVKDTEGNFGYSMVICNGSCNRKNRPLACRIYPYFPMIRDDGFDVRADIRGIRSCPLLYKSIKPEYGFIRQIRKIARVFSADEEMTEYIKNINLMLDEIEETGLL